ncbi:MAG: potassium channel family protein [Muribaculaceae bacterium]|nr:potassium channel family protein [Muribaculaceae bacterium]
MRPEPTPAKAPQPAAKTRKKRAEYVLGTMNFIVLVLSVLLIVWISFDTFKRIDFLENHAYMTFQLWVCVVFVIDFFVGLAYSENKGRFFWHRLVFLLLSIPYLNIINQMDVHLSHDALYFVRFIPLARGALALSIVISYLSSNAVTSLFISYLSIMILVGYFCSLIFYQREAGVNPQVNSYWTALWWSAMNMSTVGCDISPVTVSGKIVAVILPVSGMIIFPLFTVYLTDYVTRSIKKGRREDADKDSTVA